MGKLFYSQNDDKSGYFHPFCSAYCTTLYIEDINHIRRKGAPISRAAVAKELGLTKATVSAIVQALLEDGLLKEVGSEDTSYGRKPILLQFCEDAGYAISVDVGVETLSAIRTNLIGKRTRLIQHETPADPEEMLEEILRLIQKLKEEAEAEQKKKTEETPEKNYGLVGVALGIHGAVKDNVITFAPYYPLSGWDLAGRLEAELGVPVYLENEANLSVIGEDSFVYDYPILANISVHTGVGLGVIVEDELYTGFNGNAGEIGHTIVEVDGRPCPCGNKGCLEQYVSERVLLREFAERKGLPSVDMDTFFEYHRAKDPDAKYILDQFVRYMSVCVNNVLKSFNPDIVIINSLFVVNSPGLIKRIEQSLSSRVNHYVEIVPSGLQDASILLGGISVAVRKFLGINHLHFDLWG